MEIKCIVGNWNQGYKQYFVTIKKDDLLKGYMDIGPEKLPVYNTDEKRFLYQNEINEQFSVFTIQ